MLHRQGGGGGSDPCAVCKNIAFYRMRLGNIGDLFGHSVADDLNIYYEQFPCVGTPKFQFHIDRISLENKWKLVLFTRPRPSWRAFIEEIILHTAQASDPPPPPLHRIHITQPRIPLKTT